MIRGKQIRQVIHSISKFLCVLKTVSMRKLGTRNLKTKLIFDRKIYYFDEKMTR